MPVFPFGLWFSRFNLGEHEMYVLAVVSVFPEITKAPAPRKNQAREGFVHRPACEVNWRKILVLCVRRVRTGRRFGHPMQRSCPYALQVHGEDSSDPRCHRLLQPTATLNPMMSPGCGLRKPDPGNKLLNIDKGIL
jgi:hypothetical protein